MLYAYSVFDAGTESYSAPFFCRARGEAIRSFTEAVGDPKSTVGKYPQHFSLWYVGTFDDSCCVFTMAAPGIAALVVSAREVAMVDVSPGSS
jgi:hypothetical protein